VVAEEVERAVVQAAAARVPAVDWAEEDWAAAVLEVAESSRLAACGGERETVRKTQWETQRGDGEGDTV
jgi:hypothetical protein